MEVPTCSEGLARGSTRGRARGGPSSLSQGRGRTSRPQGPWKLEGNAHRQRPLGAGKCHTVAREGAGRARGLREESRAEGAGRAWEVASARANLAPLGWENLPGLWGSPLSEETVFPALPGGHFWAGPSNAQCAVWRRLPSAKLACHRPHCGERGFCF